MAKLLAVLLACLAAQGFLGMTGGHAEGTRMVAGQARVPMIQRPVLLQPVLQQVAPPSTPPKRLWRRHLYSEPPAFCRPGSPTFGYDGGFYLRGGRGMFTFGPGAYTMLRWTRNERTSVPAGEERETQDVGFARTRVLFQGDLTHRFDYDFRLNIDHTGDIGILVASLQWHVSKRWSVKAGQFYLAVQREDWTAPEDLLTTEFSANDLIFAPGIGQGLQAHWKGTEDRAWLAFSDGEFRGGNHLVGQTGNAEWALTGRYEHQFGTRDWSLWDDLVGRRDRKCGFLVGVAGGVGHGNGQIDVEQAYLLTADASYAWNGGQALVFANVRRAEMKDGTTADTFGLLAQAGQFVTCTSQLYARYEFVAPGSTPGTLETYHSVAAGYSYLPFRWTNRYKLTAEFSYLFTPLSRTIVPGGGVLGFLPSDETQFYVRVQLQFGF